MPYKRVGGTKVSDHHVQSPLLNVNNSCGTCHKYSDQESARVLGESINFARLGQAAFRKAAAAPAGVPQPADALQTGSQ